MCKYFWLVRGSFYGMSTIIVYLMPNPFYTYKQFYFKQFSLAKYSVLFTHS